MSAEVYAKYLDPSITGTSGSAFAQLIEDLSNNASTVVVDGATAGTNPSIPFVGMINHGSGISGAPKAYINMLVFDLNYNLVNSSFKQVDTSAEEDGTDIAYQPLNIAPITIEEPGYVYIYLSNENGTSIEVFFDDFGVTHENTEIVQKDDYYPFGGSFNSYQNPSSLSQKYLYNGKELQAETDWYDYGARMYDPWLGRWNHVDPMAQEREWLSSYNFVQNNPINRIDPDGRFDWVAKKDGEVYWDENATSQATTKEGEEYLGKSGTGVDESTGNTLVYNSDGTVSEGTRGLGEVTVTATQSEEDKVLSNPVVQDMRANSEKIRSEAIPFAKHMIRSSIDAVGYTGASITGLGVLITPFAPHAGAGLVASGGTISTFAGGASAIMYAAEGDYKSAAIEGTLTVTGGATGKYLKNLSSSSKGLINSKDLTVLEGLKNSSLDIVNLIIVPKVK